MEFIQIALRIVQFAVPTALASLGETVGQKTGVLNIGLEGTMLLSAFTGVSVTSITGSAWLGLISGFLVGTIIALLQGIFTVILNCDQVVAGTAINLLGLGISTTLFDIFVANNFKLSQVNTIGSIFGIVDPVLLFLPLGILGTYWFLFKTEMGLIFRGVGEYPPAIEAAGFSVIKVRILGQMICGAFAGLAGAYLSVGIAQSFVPNMTSGRGFIALALVTFGRWKPIWVVASALLIGCLEWLQFSIQGKTPLPTQLFLALPYVVALVTLILVGKGTQQPQSLGIPYDKRN